MHFSVVAFPSLLPVVNQTIPAGLYRKPFVIEGNEINISAGIGIAIYPDHASDDTKLMKNADAALYEVKKDGKMLIKRLEAINPVDKFIFNIAFDH